MTLLPAKGQSNAGVPSMGLTDHVADRLLQERIIWLGWELEMKMLMLFVHKCCF